MMSEEKQSKLAIIGGTLVDGTGKEQVEDATVVVVGTKIVDVGKRSAIKIPENSRIVDASGLTIMPGMINCHVHLTGSVGNFLESVIEPKYIQVLRAATSAWKLLDYGFTTVRDISMFGVPLKKAMEEGVITGPRIIPCGRGLCKTGGHGNIRRDIYQLPDQFVKDSHPWAVVCDGVEALRVAVRDAVWKGAEDSNLQKGNRWNMGKR